MDEFAGKGKKKVAEVTETRMHIIFPGGKQLRFQLIIITLARYDFLLCPPPETNLQENAIISI